ncbi:MAG: beta-hydroxyacyl-ACP dehydratase [Planctomycetaceae bacterium]|jgi:3-hydroxyacyl-[acyl-carrier-protein] dehydratase|nr:beta-hydroxyacyl-ACP dehydratase [Planctomycetaceae bacterium]
MSGIEEVKAAIPHREPFLFVDEIVEYEDKRILCKKTFTGEEDFFRGHYPGGPLVPGVLLCEAAMQTGAILLTKIFADESLDGRVPVVAKMGEVRFKQMVHPGDTVLMEAKFRDKMKNVYFLHVKVTANGKTCVQFDVACALTEKPE